MLLGLPISPLTIVYLARLNHEVSGNAMVLVPNAPSRTQNYFHHYTDYGRLLSLSYCIYFHNLQGEALFADCSRHSREKGVLLKAAREARLLRASAP